MRAIDGDKVLKRIEELERGMWQLNFPYEQLADEIEKGKFDLDSDTPAPPRESPDDKGQTFYRVKTNIMCPTGLPGKRI